MRPADVHDACHLAQVNIGTMRAPTDDPAVSEFMDNLDQINAKADAAPGFVWRMQTAEGDASSIRAFPNPLELVNMSVWQSVETLRDYVYRSDHVDFFRRRADWFEADAKRVALWWIPAGVVPDLVDAVHRVEFLERHGPSPYAFGFARADRPLIIEDTTPDEPHTLDLVGRLNAELTALADDPCENHFSLTNAETTGNNGRMIRARYDGRLVGCGAVRRIEPTIGELKRMFVDESSRGLKIGAALLDRLEVVAARLGLAELRLETSARQPAAIALYEGAGFTPCDPWGEYLATATTSRCYRKALSSTRPPTRGDRERSATKRARRPPAPVEGFSVA